MPCTPVIAIYTSSNLHSNRTVGNALLAGSPRNLLGLRVSRAKATLLRSSSCRNRRCRNHERESRLRSRQNDEIPYGPRVNCASTRRKDETSINKKELHHVSTFSIAVANEGNEAIVYQCKSSLSFTMGRFCPLLGEEF